MSKVKPWLFLAVIFIAGMVAGAALTVGLAGHFKRPPGITERMMTRLTKELELTPEQQAKVQPILTESSNQLQAVRHDQFEQMSKIFEKTNQRLAEVLTPEQRGKLAKMQREMEENRDRLFPNRGKWLPGQRGPGPGAPGGQMPPPPRDEAGAPPPKE